MVSNASEDLPEPDTPLITMNRLRGSSSETFFRLWTLAWRIASVRRGSGVSAADGGADAAERNGSTADPGFAPWMTASAVFETVAADEAGLLLVGPLPDFFDRLVVEAFAPVDRFFMSRVVSRGPGIGLVRTR
jgi:hypothetical protein